MSRNPKSDPGPAAAQSSAGPRVAKPSAVISNAETLRLLHELDVHQIELEMQNSELRDARDESEALLYKYTELYEYAPFGYFTLASDGTIRLANLSGSIMVGCERSDLIGSSFATLIAQGQRASFKAFLEQVFALEANQTGEFELNGANETKRIISMEAKRYPDGMGCSATIMDITERRQAQELMRVSESRYRRLFEAAHDGVLLIDPGTNRIIDANPFMSRLLGYSRDQLIGKELYEIGLLKDESACRTMFGKLKRNHEVRYEDLPLQGQTGRHHEVEVVANLYQEDGRSVIQCNIRDITARKLAEKTLHHNNKLKKEIERRMLVAEELRAKRKEQSLLLRQSRLQQKQLRDFSHRILNVQEDERKRISRELHDVVAQNLVGIQVHLELLARMADTGDEFAQMQISSSRKIVGDAVDLIHTFARELRPSMLDHLGLIPALQATLKDFMESTGIRVSLQTSTDDVETGSAERTVLYRIAQEALTNVARHSKAAHAEIRIEALGKSTRMTIKDFGKGFVPSGGIGSVRNNRIGLVGMRERAEMIGGTFRLDSSPGGPTTVIVEVPVSGSV